MDNVSKYESQSNTGLDIRYLTVTGMLAAVAVVLQYLEFPVPVMPPFIKMDLSDLPALIGAFSMGPVCGVAVCLIKNIIHMAVSQSAMVGELCNFLLSACFVLPAGIIYKYSKNKRGALIGAVTGAVVMAVLSLPINYFIVYPMYEALFGMPREAIVGAYQVILPSMKNLLQCLIVFNVPFTFVKAMISVVITLLVYKKLSPFLRGNN